MVGEKEMTIELPITGSCQCGNVTYRATEAPVTCIVCHCTDCQKFSASAYGTTMVFRADALRIEGELKTWERIADSGNRNIAHFCPHCGNRIYHADSETPTLIRLKAGTIDSGKIPVPRMHVWVSRKQPWVTIPEGVPAHEKNRPSGPVSE